MNTVLLTMAFFCLFAGSAIGAPIRSADLILPPTQGPSGQEDPKKIIEKIQKEMEEINRLLNQASRSSSSSSSSSSSGSSSPESSSSAEQLKKSLDSSDAVIEGIDTLLRMAGKGGKSGAGSGKKPQGKEQGKGQGEPRKPDDRQGQNPDFVNQGEKKGEKPGQKGDPKGERKDPKNGKNIKQKNRKDNPTEKNNKKAESGGWGNLPPYLQKLFKAGGKPEVPARYREFEKEFHRNADKKKKR